MRVLVGILAHQLHSEVVRRVHSLDWPDPSGGYDVLTMWGQNMQDGETRFAAITRKYAQLQRTFLSGPWDALLCVEQDMLLPVNTLVNLSQLVCDGADVAYGLYVWRYETQHWWSAYPKLTLSDEDGAPRFWSLTHQPEEARRLWGRPVLVQGLGLGCTLIPRTTLTRIPFRQIHAEHSCDTAFALDCVEDGLHQVADLSVVCGHRMNDRHVVWPDPTAESLYRIEETVS